MLKKPRCLIVDDETDLGELLIITLNRMGIEADDAKFMLRQRAYDLCLTDMRLPDGNGLDLVRHISQYHIGLPVAVITAFGSAENAVSALKAGAFDYITKPISLQQLRPLVQSALKLSQPQKPIAATEELHLIGKSELIDKVRASMGKYSHSQAPVHISGEPGTGKELAGRLIHANSARRDGPFVAVNCSAIAENAMEHAFFGYKKGAFSGAVQDKKGYFQAANGGVLFLNELASLPLGMQVKLLRVIQEKQVLIPGTEQEEAIDVRIISATHRDLSAIMESGNFRQDLYYRLNVISLKMPALREISDDIPLLTAHLLEKLCKDLGIEVPAIDSDAMALLRQYRFPGNVRELESILQRALTLSNGSEIRQQDIELPAASKQTAVNLDANGIPLPEFLEGIEKQAILDALEKTRQNKTAAAKLLGVSFRTLRYRLSKLGLSKDTGDQEEE